MPKIKVVKANKPAEETRDISSIDMEDILTAEPLNAALSSLYQEMGIEGELASYVVVHQVDPATGKEARVWKDSVDKYDLDQIAKRFGSGDYVVRVYVQREDRGYSCRGSKVFSVKLDPAEDAALKALREGRSLPVAAPASAGPSLMDILTLLNQSQQNMMQMLAPILAGNAGAKQNTLAELKGLAETFGMMPGAGAKSQGPLEMLAMFKQFMELTGSLKPEKPLTEDEVGPNALLMKGLEVFMETVKGAKQAQAEGAGNVPHVSSLPHPSVLPAPAVVPVAAAPQPALSPENAEMQLFLKMQLAMMLRAAENDSDVETYAALVFEQAPDELIDDLHAAEWFTKLCDIEPKCAAFQVWFTKLHERVIEMLAEEKVDAEDTVGKLTPGANASTVAG